MVSTVTTYHKGYSVTGSTKIIHRYLPKEVGELLVYYLWIIQPFCRKLHLLVYDRSGWSSPFVWAKDDGLEPWDSSRLSRILRREFQADLGVTMNIPYYRHLAIAISWKHLGRDGFKRDYEAEDTPFDKQASHTSWTAGNLYARGLEEAPGHVEARKAEYRKISKEWHAFLRFTPSSLPPRKHVSGDIADKGNGGVQKRRCVSKGGQENRCNNRGTETVLWEF